MPHTTRSDPTSTPLAPRSVPGSTIILCVLAWVLALLVIYYLYWQVPKYTAVFSDTEASMPWLGMAFSDLSAWPRIMTEWSAGFEVPGGAYFDMSTHPSGRITAPPYMPFGAATLVTILATLGIILARRIKGVVTVLATLCCSVSLVMLILLVTIMESTLFKSLSSMSMGTG